MIEEFLAHLTYVRNASIHTQRAYKKDLYTTQQTLKTDWDKITSTQIYQYVWRSGFKPNTAYRKLAALKAFYRWLAEEKKILYKSWSDLQQKFDHFKNAVKSIVLIID